MPITSGFNHVATLTTDRALLLYGLPGTAKSWVSEHLAAAISGDSTLIIQGTAGNDTLDGSHGGAVTLQGGAGNDTLIIADQHFASVDGGTGTDTFFTDARAPGAVWNTIRNLHAGDAATLWGFNPGVSSFRWDGVAGAAGFQGATLRANIAGGASRTGGVDASITFAGLTMQQAQGLQITTGTQLGGSYLYIYDPGV